MPQHLCERQDNVATSGIVGAHATGPETVLLRAVVERQGGLLDDLEPLARREAQRIPAALQRVEELGAVVVVPCARVHGAATQPEHHRQMLDAAGALILAATA